MLTSCGRMLLHAPGALGLHLFPAFFLLGFTLFPFFLYLFTAWGRSGSWGLLTRCGRILLHLLGALGLHLLPAFFLLGFLLFPLFCLFSFPLFPLLLHLLAARYRGYRRNSRLAPR